MPDWSTMLSLPAFGLVAWRIAQVWVPTLDFLHRCIETLHRNRQERRGQRHYHRKERRYQRQYDRIARKRLAEASGDDLVKLMDDYTDKWTTYVGREKSGSRAEQSASDDEDDKRGQNAPTALKPIDRPA